ncbi:MAG: peptidylprolyl isomerase [Nitrospiraceae bacterium]|nr:peptidylprolyl isomerase [Nitrospiraceae bacterium]
MPNVFRVRYDTSKGPVVIELHKEWAPNGVARFYELVKMGFFDGCRFFRVVTKPKPFVVQWGIPGEPKLAKKWNNRTIKDDKVMKTNAVGTVTFAAGRAPNSRSTQLFINLGDNKFLDGMGFAPIGYVVEGMEIVRQFNDEYQEKVTDRQGDIVSKGNAWLDEAFPGLDYVKKATIVK